jgi:NAD+--asparagine ADP-ribosyltransferase
VHELKYAEEGINYPVIHPNCRCTVVPAFDDEISELFNDDEDTRLAYGEDRTRYEVPASMTYKEWREMVGESSD